MGVSLQVSAERNFEIVAEWKAGLSCYELGKIYDLSPARVRQIVGAQLMAEWKEKHGEEDGFLHGRNPDA